MTYHPGSKFKHWGFWESVRWYICAIFFWPVVLIAFGLLIYFGLGH